MGTISGIVTDWIIEEQLMSAWKIRWIRLLMSSLTTKIDPINILNSLNEIDLNRKITIEKELFYTVIYHKPNLNYEILEKIQGPHEHMKQQPSYHTFTKL